MPYPTIVTDADAANDRVNQFRDFTKTLPDPVQAQTDADVAAFQQHTASLGTPKPPPDQPVDAPISTSTGTPPKSDAGAVPSDAGGTIDPSSHQAFVQGLAPLAQAWQQKTGIPAATWLAMAASESNWGQAGTALFGIKGSGNAGSLNSPTWESVNGERVNQNDNFATYKTANDAFAGFWDLMHAPRYAGALQALQQGGDFVGAINRAGYATDPNWSRSIQSIASNQITPLLGGVGANSPSQTQTSGMAANPSAAPAASFGNGLDGGYSKPQDDTSGAQPSTPNDDLKAFSQYVSTLGAPGSATPAQQAPYNDMAGVDTTPKLSLTDAPTLPASPESGGGFDPLGMARHAIDGIGNLFTSDSTPSPRRAFSLAGYDDMAGATSAPGQQGLSSTYGQPEGIQAAGTPGFHLLPGNQPLTDIGNAAKNWVQEGQQQQGYAYTPTLGTRADQPARSQPLGGGPLGRSYTPEQLQAQQEGTLNAVIGATNLENEGGKLVASIEDASGGMKMPWQMTRDEFHATGEPLLHGTSRSFDTFGAPGTVDRYGRKPIADRYYFTDQPGVADTFANSGGYRQVDPAHYDGDWEDLTPQEQAQSTQEMLARLDQRIAKGNTLAYVNDDGNLQKVTAASQIPPDHLQGGDVRIYAKGRWPTVIKANVYGRTLDLTNPKQIPADLLEALKYSGYNPANPGVGDFSHEYSRQLIDYAAAKGYGKIKVKDAYESGFTSTIALKDFIEHNTDPHRTLVANALAEGKPVPYNVLAQYPDLSPASVTRRSRTIQSAPAIGGALVGGYAGNQAPASNDQERLRNTLIGAGTGAALGYGAERLGARGELSRLVTDDSGMAGRVPMPPRPAIPPPVPGKPLDTLLNMYKEPPKEPGLSPPEIAKRTSDAFVRAWTDRGVDLAHFQNDVAKDIKRPLRPDEMAYELARLNPDMAATVRVQEGLRPALLQVGEQDRPALSTYLTAKHNIDVAKSMGQKVQTEALKEPLPKLSAEQRVKSVQGQIKMYERLRAEGVAHGDGTVVTHYDDLLTTAKVNLGRAQKLALRQVTAADAARAAGAQVAGREAAANREFSGGINAAESQQALTDLEATLGPQRFANVEAAAQKVSGFVDSLRDRAVSSGLWSPELAAELKKQYPNYAPTKILDYMQEPGNIPNGKSLSVRDQGLKRLTVEGTNRLREDPLSSLVRSSYQMEALATKNDAFNAFVKLNNLKAPADRIIKEVPDSYTATVHEAKVTGFIDGKRVTYVMPKEYETIVKGEPSAPIKGLATVMGLYKSILTAKNPAFVANQVPLDALSYIAREATRAGGPQALPHLMVELGKAYWDAFQGIGTRTFHGDTAAFLKGGGGMGGFFQGSPGDVRTTVEDLARPSAFTINSAADIRRLIKDVLTLKPVEAFGERAELAPRVAARRLALNRGQSELQGNIAGRNVTMDFQQGGTVAKFINQFVPFFNVGMQGIATPARIVRENPRGALLSFMGLLAAPTISSEIWNNADPQRAKDYADVPQYIKNRSVVFMLPLPASVDTQGERHPQYVEIRARELAPFVDLTRQTMHGVLGDNTQSWADMLGGAVNASSPVQTDSALGFFGSLVPPGISTGLDLANNRDSYRGSTIATKGNDERASALSKGLANGIFQATGANARPSQVEFAARDLTGGIGQMARDASNMIAQQPSGGTPQDTPILGQVTRRFVGGSIGQRLQSAQDQRVSPQIEGILRDAGIFDLTPVQDTIGKVPLSRDEQAAYQQITNDAINELLPSVAESPAYQRLSTSDKAIVLHNVMDKARAFAADEAKKQVNPAGLRDRLERQLQPAS